MEDNDKTSSLDQKKEIDDLTQIKGIGKIRQQWFRENCSVLSFRDLANLDPIEVEKMLSKEKASSPIKEINQWINAAAQLADQARAIQKDDKKIDNEDETDSKPKLNFQDIEVHSIAAFMVDYQNTVSTEGKHTQKTLVTLIDPETTEALMMHEWQGLEYKKAFNWMRRTLEERLDERRQTENAPPTEPENKQKEPAAHILSYRVHWPNGMLQFTPPFDGNRLITLKKSETFDLEVEFRLENIPVNGGNEQTYYAGCHALPVGKTASEQSCLQGEKKRQLRAGEKSGIAYILNLELACGHYETWISITPTINNSISDLIKGPRIVVA